MMYALNKHMMDGTLSQEDLVEFLNLCGAYLNISSPPEYAAANNISVQAAHQSKKCRTIFGKKFIIETE